MSWKEVWAGFAIGIVLLLVAVILYSLSCALEASPFKDERQREQKAEQFDNAAASVEGRDVEIRQDSKQESKQVGDHSGDNWTTRLFVAGAIVLGTAWVIVDRRRYHGPKKNCRPTS